MIFHPLLAVVVTLILIQGFLFWASWYRTKHFKWDDCPECGAMIEMHRQESPEGEPIWRGNCDHCYNIITQYTDYNG